MVAHEESWTILPETCINKPCNETCTDSEICKLCLRCMNNNQKHELHLAYREAKNRGAMKRVFPAPEVRLKFYKNYSIFFNQILLIFRKKLLTWMKATWTH